MQTSTRFQVQYPSAGRSDSADVPRDFISVVTGLEKAAMYGQGTLAARPVSTAGSPGIQGRFYAATDQSPIALYYDFGTGWASIGSLAAGSIGTVQLADGAVTTPKLADLAVITGKIADLAVTAAKIADGTVTAAKIAAALFPSQGAGAGTEALRAIGSGAGQVVAGNDARLTDTRTPSLGRDPTAFGTNFPTSGLFTGYVFTIYMTMNVGQWRAVTCMYRPDLDATFPWFTMGDSWFITVTSGNNGIQLTVAKSGIYNVRALATGGNAVTISITNVSRTASVSKNSSVSIDNVNVVLEDVGIGYTQGNTIDLNSTGNMSMSLAATPIRMHN